MKLIIKNRLCLIEEKEVLLSGNVNTYFLEVEYDDIYNGRQLIIYFKNDDVKKISLIGPNNKVIIPHEVLKKSGKLYIGVFSPNFNDNTLIDRYCSNLEDLKVIEGAYDKEATYTEELTPTILEQYLQEMKDFYNESMQEYNNNAIQKIEEYNTNAKLKKEEIDAVVREVIKNKEDIEEIEKRVKTSEQNAKASETNAKTSEQNAQNSANKALECESNIISIQEDINASKTHIDDQKAKVDKSVDDVEKLVDEATQQANISKENADLSIENAGQVSADKNAVENMMNAVSTMKTSAEQTKSATEQIKTDTQAIYDNTVIAKNETLQAKEEVEKSLENERIESDKKYARAIESDEIVVDSFEQIELDEDGYMKDISIESALPEITQKTRSGANLYNVKDIKRKSDEVIVDENDIITIKKDNTEGTSSFFANFMTKYSDRFEPNHEYFLIAEILDVNGSGRIHFSSNHDSDKPQFTTSEYRDFNTLSLGQKIITSIYTGENNWMGLRSFATFAPGQSGTIKFRISILENEPTEENFEYEKFGVSPSLDYPSEFENIVKNVDIQNNQKNFLDMSNAKGGSNSGINITVNSDGSYSYVGTATNLAINVWFLGGYNKDIPVFVLKAGTYFCKDVRIYNKITCVVNENNAVTLTEDTPITGVRAAQAVTGQTYNEIKYPMIVKIEDKDIPYEQYKGQKEQVALSEGQFLGKFNGYKNYIENNKLKGRLKILTLTGEENWQLNTTKEKTQVFLWYLGRNMVNNIGICSHLKFNAPGDSEKCTVYNRGVYLAINKTTASTVEEIKALLAQKYQEGNPVKVLYVTTKEYEEDLSAENKSKINNFKIYKGTNNIYSNCKIKFEANKNLKAELDKCVKNTDFATNNEAGIIKSRSSHGFNVDSSGNPYLSTYDEEYKNLPESSFVSAGTLKKVENRIVNNSDNRYPKALKDKVIDKDLVQIYADNSKIDNLVIKGNQLKQETHTSTNNILYSEEKYWKVGSLNSSNGQPTENNARLRTKEFIPVVEQEDYFASTDNSNYVWVNIHYYNTNKEFIITQQALTSNVDGNTNVSIMPPQGAKYLKAVIRKSNYEEMSLSDISIAKPMMVKGTSKIDYVEGYPIMPSLEYPSSIDLTTEQNIQINKENLIDTSGIDKILGTLRINSQEDGSIKYYGAPAGTWTSLKTVNLKVPIKAGTEIIMSYGLNEELRQDNGFNPFLWFFNKNGDNFGTVNKHNILNKKPVKLEQDVYKLTLGIQDLIMDQEYEGKMYIELERANEMPTEFHKFKENDYSVTLPENEFNNAIGDYKNEIKKVDGKWCLVKYIKELILDGTENWGRETTAIGKRFILDLNEAIISNSNNSPTALCTHFGLGKDGSTWGELNLFVIYQLANFRRLAFGSFDNINEISEWKAILAEQKEKGTPVKVYYTLGNPEIIELSEEAQNTLNSIELMYDLNNISIDNGMFSFEYNKPIAIALKEERESREKLEVKVEELINLLRTPSTSPLLINNLANDLESEVE